MLKTILAVLGALAILVVVIVVGGGYFAVKKGSSAIVQVTQQQVDQFIVKNHPAEPVANSLHRLVNAAKLHQSWTTTMLLGSALNVMQTGTVTDDQAKMLDEAAQLAEQGDVTREQAMAFMKKYESIIPRRAYQPRPS